MSGESKNCRRRASRQHNWGGNGSDGALAQLQAFRAVIDSLEDAVILTDAEGRIIYANEGSDKLFGFEPEELLASSITLVMPEWCQDRLAASDLTGIEVNVRRKEGSEFAVDLTVSRDPRVPELAFVFRNNRLLKATETELQSAAIRLYHRDKARQQFLAHVSHEIRTPLTAVLGFAELIQKEPGLTTNTATWIEKILGSGRHLLQIVNDILSLARVEAQGIDLDPAPCEMADLVVGAVDLVSAKVKAKDLDMKVEATGQLPARFVGDMTRIRQVLVNLMGNAVKFTENGGITLSVSAEDQGDSAEFCFSVIDTGIGIPEDRLDSIFESFEQSDASIARRYGGTGLGLAISKKLCEAMQGDLTVDSVLGEGSTFSGRLRLSEPQDWQEGEDVLARGVQRHEADADSIRLKGTVLVVDDSEDLRLLTIQYLKQLGVDAVEAGNGQEALDRVAEGGSDLVLMDRNMPVMDGMEAVRRLRADKNTIPVLALSAGALPEDIHTYQKAGFDGFLSKPIDFNQLASRLAEYLPDEPAEAQGTTPAAPAKKKPVSPLATNSKFKALLQKYVSTLGETLDIIAKACESGDLDALRAEAHKVRGTAGSYGLADIRDVTARIEDGIAAGETAFEDAVRDLGTAIEAAMSELEPEPASA